MQDVLASFKERREILDEFLCVYLGSFRFSAMNHRLVEIVEGNGLPQIIAVLFPIQVEMKADIMDIPVLKMLFGKVCCLAAAQHKITHVASPPLFRCATPLL